MSVSELRFLLLFFPPQLILAVCFIVTNDLEATGDGIEGKEG